MMHQEKECYICGTTCNLEKHHVYLGANRKVAEKYGLTVWLCHYHHQDHKEGVHHNKEMMDRLHRLGQKYFEKRIGTREDFLREFGRNYLD